MPHTHGSPRQALCIGLSTFGDHENEPLPGSYADLPYAQPRVNELAAALTGFGYTCQTFGERDLRSAAALGAKVTSAIDHADGEAQVIHVLSHGHRAPSSVYVIGADGEYAAGTSVANWVALVQDFPADRRPHTLFLIDTCHAGAAARLDWLRAADSDTRAWVIAATPDESLAYDGRFSQAVANVLARIQTGDIDLYPSDYIPFGSVVKHIRREVVTLGGDSQHVSSTPVDGSPEPPFFPNPRPPLPTGVDADGWATVDAAIQPFVELDLALDEAHFLDRATGPADPAGRFGGREHELESLTAWLDDPDGGALRLITGGPGSGKSPLLGLLVCAAHPALRDRTRRLWEHVPGAPAHPIDDLAAVHLCERDLTETLASLTRQLALPLKRPGPSAAAAVAAITVREHPPVLVFDALDEALTQTALIQELLLPLAAATRPDGRPACRLLVGMRPSEQFAALRDLAGRSGAVIDLDEAELDLDGHADQPWFRPILLALAHARGAGMPATVIRRLAPLCRTYPSPSDARGPLTVTEFDQALRQVRFSRGRLLRALSIPSLDVAAGTLSLACAQTGGAPVLITADRKEPVRMWNLATGEPTGKPITDHGRWIKEMAAVTVSGRPLLVAVCRTQGVAVWDLEDGLPLHPLMVLRPGPETAEAVPLDGADVQVMTCGPVEGRALVVIGDAHSVVRVWDLLTGTQLDEFTFPGSINALSLTEDGDLLVGFGGEVACLRRVQPVAAGYSRKKMVIW